MKNKKIDLLIIGSGPAGYTAAIYAARAGLKPVLIQGIHPGGQLTTTTDVENYPGFAKKIQGPWLMQEMEAQARTVGADIIGDNVDAVDLMQRPFKVKTASGILYETRSMIVCTGAQAKWLGLSSEEEFKGFGVSGCATCDGFFFRGKPVAVIGGGNTAVEEALYLANQASRVYLVHRRDQFRAEKILQQRLFGATKISLVLNHVLTEIVGVPDPKRVTSIKLESIVDHSVTELDVEGVFIAIGHKPSTELFKGQIDIDDDGYIVTQPGTTKTSVAGVFAAGDVQDKVYRQAVTAAGTGCMAALEADKFLHMSIIN